MAQTGLLGLKKGFSKTALANIGNQKGLLHHKTTQKSLKVNGLQKCSPKSSEACCGLYFSAEENIEAKKRFTKDIQILSKGFYKTALKDYSADIGAQKDSLLHKTA